MRSPLRDLLAERGAVFGERAGAEVALRFAGAEEEYAAVRARVGLTDFSFATRHRVPEEGLDVLERYAAGAVAGIRFGRVLHTLAADEGGGIEADLYVANDDEHLLLVGESLVGDTATGAALDDLGARAAGLEDIAPETALIGVDGVEAWAVVKALFGADVLGLPYLSIETYELNGHWVKLVRAGKTSEFGYLLLVPAEGAERVWERLEEAGEPFGIAPIGAEAHGMLRLDGRFFNVHAEGAAVRDPLPLGLQWMIDFHGDDFRGKEAILGRRAAGVGEKIIGVAPADPGAGLEAGDRIDHLGEEVARVVVAERSPTLGRPIGLALFDRRWAYAGLDLEAADGRRFCTLSMPPFTPRSLTVRLDEM